ncbi:MULTISPECIES: hypothetical protein [unclassified Sulfitobacter]|uniref:hypothetical protein n=1 Tax=unclassified Sulfitobacter TaxID=196795 RepID=UPI003745A86C
MSDSKYNLEQETRLQEILNRGQVRDCIRRIVTARGLLRELGSSEQEFQYEQDNRVELEKEFDRLLGDVNAAIGELQDIILQSEIDLPVSINDLSDGQEKHWSLGTENIRGPLIPFLRGELEPVRKVVVAPNLPYTVVLFFLSISGLREHLVREVHGHWGYHYHYLDSKRRRSDTLLTFQQKPKTLPKGRHVRVLTWERHSEKSHFPARATRWGAKKRESVYQACIDDSAKRSLSDFKIPAKHSEVLWPV